MGTQKSKGSHLVAASTLFGVADEFGRAVNLGRVDRLPAVNAARLVLGHDHSEVYAFSAALAGFGFLTDSTNPRTGSHGHRTMPTVWPRRMLT